LYDLEKDKSEMNNVYDQPAYKKVQEMMMKKAERKERTIQRPGYFNDLQKIENNHGDTRTQCYTK
jgi:hypothetical protein